MRKISVDFELEYDVTDEDACRQVGNFVEDLKKMAFVAGLRQPTPKVLVTKITQRDAGFYP